MTWQADDVLKVPVGALFHHGAGWAAYRIDDGRAELVELELELGHRGEDEVEVLRGLAANERVAVYPGDRLKDGARVSERAGE